MLVLIHLNWIFFFFFKGASPSTTLTYPYISDLYCFSWTAHTAQFNNVWQHRNKSNGNGVDMPVGLEILIWLSHVMYMLKWHLITLWLDLVKVACWTLPQGANCVCLQGCRSLSIHFPSSHCFLLCSLSALLLTWVEKWQAPSHEVKCIRTFWYHCSREPNIIWSHLISTLIQSDRTTFGSLFFPEHAVFFFGHFSLYLRVHSGERHTQPELNPRCSDCVAFA